MELRKISDSFTEQSIIVTYEHINGAGRLFGGRLSEWIDNVGGIVAKRHSNKDVTTASMDIDFLAPAYVNNTVTIKGRIIYTGNTSMLICVDAYSEDYVSEKVHIAQAHLVMVSMGKDDMPEKTNPIKPQSKEEESDYKKGEERMRIKREIRQKMKEIDG